MEFHQVDTSDCDDSDASSYIYPFDDIDVLDPELIKIAQFYKALPNCTPLMFGLTTVSHNYIELRCPSSKYLTG